MMNFDFYDSLMEDINDFDIIDKVIIENDFVKVYSKNKVGISSYVKSAGDVETKDMTGKKLKEVAKLIYSWNFALASIALAAINCYYNDLNRFDKNCLIQGNSFVENEVIMKDKIVATIGHFRFSDKYFEKAKALYVFERNPKFDDFPDTAIEYMMKDVEVVFITGQTIINKSITRILELAKNAHIVLVGFSSPLCDKLFQYGINEI
ncbi:MAG: DUF364 domain-containing protein, partial [Clostridia bacterium]